MEEDARHELRISLKKRLVELLDAQAAAPSKHRLLSSELTEERDIRFRLSRLDMADALTAELTEPPATEALTGEVVDLDNYMTAWFVDGELAVATNNCVSVKLSIAAWNELLEFAFARGHDEFRWRILGLARAWQAEQDE